MSSERSQASSAAKLPEPKVPHEYVKKGAGGTLSAATMDLTAISLLPDSITVERDVWRPGEPRWLVHDRETGLYGIVSVDTTEHEVEWTPPPRKTGWRRWLDPLGSVLDDIDREQRIARMRGRKVVDWDAVDREAKEQGASLIRELLERRAEV